MNFKKLIKITISKVIFYIKIIILCPAAERYQIKLLRFHAKIAMINLMKIDRIEDSSLNLFVIS